MTNHEEFQMRQQIRIAFIRSLEKWTADLRGQKNNLCFFVSSVRNQIHADLHYLANQMGQKQEVLHWEK
jgi:hypothetical protein